MTVAARLRDLFGLGAASGRPAVWQSHFAVRPVPLEDGTPAGGWLMRRRLDGAWRHRRMTPEEEAENVQSEAW